jgi:hypothetical protein
MPPKHRQPNAPRPKPAGNAYKALADLPHDGSDPSTDGRDGKVDGSDGKSAVNAPMHVFTAGIPAAASPPPAPTGEPPLRVWRRGLIADVTHAILHEEQMHHQYQLIHSNSDPPPLLFQQPPGNRLIFERILVQQPQFTFAQHFQTRSTLFCRVTR